MTFIIQHNGEQKQVQISEGKIPLSELLPEIIKQTSGNPTWDNVFIRWTNEPYAALDIDTDTPISENQIHYYATNTNPSPFLYWRTHGGGMRFIYYDVEGFEAKELAVLALAFMYRKWQQFTYEIKNDTRHPGYCKAKDLVTKPIAKVQDFVPNLYLQSYVQLNRTDEEVISWLETHGFGQDDRQPHSKCPFNPDEKDSRRPVAIYNDGVFCFKCKGLDRKHFAKWGELLGKKEDNIIDLMIKNLTHWGQAEIILNKLLGPMPHMNLYYKTLLKLHLKSTFEDLDEVRLHIILRSVFNKGASLIRYEGYWATIDHRIPDSGTYLKKALEQLPLFLMHNDRSLILSLTSDTVDFSQFGYPPITAVHGFPLNNVHISMDKFLKVVHQYPKNPPKYIHNVTKEKLEASWKTIEKVFPGVNKNLIYLLIAGKGVTEYPYNTPFIIYIWGPSSAAKTSSVKLAGAITGSTPVEFPWQRDEHYLGQKFLNGCRNSAYILINEVAKAQVDYNFILTLDSNKTVHQIFHGPTKLHRLPLIVLTDITIADALQRSAQYRRRINFVQLNKAVDWKESMHEAGLTSISELRDLYPEECNTILSYVADRFFSEKKSFQTIFNELGFTQEQEEMEYIKPQEKLDDMYTFFLAFCKLCKPVSESDAKRWKGKDTRLFSFTDNNLVAQLWNEYTGNDPRNIQIFLEQDWASILKVSEPVQFIINKFNGSKTGARFLGKDSGLTNEAIIGYDRFKVDCMKL